MGSRLGASLLQLRIASFSVAVICVFPDRVADYGKEDSIPLVVALSFTFLKIRNNGFSNGSASSLPHRVTKVLLHQILYGFSKMCSTAAGLLD